ncbi:substrate-binding periplasmic protein [Fluviispira vulneris]|uniref:substrate-binding periplasmic protein n=1 Tax=Fluviispira vulneris TaxID=2763012 RepID=UPI0016497199|nr:transporter substrate-binding domain-containing protein [Fluviispira vulneris]
MKLFVYLTILFSHTFNLSAYAAEEMVFVYFNDFYPYSYSSSSEKNDANGIFPHYIKELFSKINIKVTNESYSWEKAQYMVQSGEADGFITTPIEKRKEYAYFTQKSSFIIKNFLLYTKKNLENEIKKIKNIEDLKKYRICDYKGNAWSEANLSEINLIKVIKRTDCISKMNANKIDFIVANLGFYHDLKKDIKDSKIFDIPFIKKSSTHFHIGIRRDYPHSYSIIESLNHYIKLENEDNFRN